MIHLFFCLQSFLPFFFYRGFKFHVYDREYPILTCRSPVTPESRFKPLHLNLSVRLSVDLPCSCSVYLGWLVFLKAGSRNDSGFCRLLITMFKKIVRNWRLSITFSGRNCTCHRNRLLNLILLVNYSSSMQQSVMMGAKYLRSLRAISHLTIGSFSQV